MTGKNRPERGIWSKNYGNTWENAYVAGNGIVGAIVYGAPSETKLIGNHHDFFLKGNNMMDLPPIGGELETLRSIIKEKGYQEGIEFYEQEAEKRGYEGLTMSDPFHPAVQINLTLMHEDQDVKTGSFSRMIDYEKGIIEEVHETTTHKQIQKEIFVSRKTSMIHLRYTSSKPVSMSLNVVDFKEEKLRQKIEWTGDRFIQTNQYVDGTGYQTAVSVVTDGIQHHQDSSILIDRMTVLEVAIGIDQFLDVTSFEEQLQEHVGLHAELFNQVSFDLAAPEERKRSIENLLEEMELESTVPTVLYEKLYDASRYVLLSSTGTSIPNLQGIWTGSFTPAWSSDYTFDTNVQLAISSLAGLGLFSSLEGVFNKLKTYYKDFETNAMAYYGCRGYFVPPHASTTGKHVHWNHEWPLVFWTAGAGWLGHYYNEYYEYTQNKQFLEQDALPFYEQTILFYEDFLVEDLQGNLLFQPSYSAENGMGNNATMDVAVLKETLTNVIKAYETLQKDVPEKYKAMLNKLPQYQLNKAGILKEWIDDSKEENFNHRHFSQFYPVFESREITPSNAPELWQAAQKTYDKKLEAWLLNEEQENSSSHGRMHAAMIAITLERPDDFSASLNELIVNHSFYDSLVTSHYNQQEVFNIDSNGAIPKLIHDSLLYWQQEEGLVLFKAVPEWLQKGVLKGIKLPKGITVDRFEWDLHEGWAKLNIISKQNAVVELSVAESRTAIKNSTVHHPKQTVKLTADTITQVTIRIEEDQYEKETIY